MMTENRQKAIVVTGGTKGIGLALVQKFAAEGWLVITCARKTEGFTATLGSLQQRVFALPCDMGQAAQVKAFAVAALRIMEQENASLEVLVNNAGLFIPGQVHTEAEGLLEQQLNLNVLSAYHATRGLLAPMLAQKRGYVFNMCSIASLVAYPNGGSYTISKFALLGMTKVLRQELLHAGIRVTAVMPGATLTASWEGVELPEERFMPAVDVAQAVWDAYSMSHRTVIEEIIMRPQLGDIN